METDILLLVERFVQLGAPQLVIFISQLYLRYTKISKSLNQINLSCCY